MFIFIEEIESKIVEVSKDWNRFFVDSVWIFIIYLMIVSEKVDDK